MKRSMRKERGMKRKGIKSKSMEEGGWRWSRMKMMN